MTKKRSEIEASLAKRGRPAMWANEQEAAVLSGYGADGVDFRAALPDLEKRGFPPVNSDNRKRFIPAMERFFWNQLDGVRQEAEKLPPGIRSMEEIIKADREARPGAYNKQGIDEDDGLECWRDSSSPTGYIDQRGRPRPAPPAQLGKRR